MRYILFLLSFFTIINIVNAERIFTTSQPYYQNNYMQQYNNPNYYHNKLSRDLGNLERYALKKSFTRESDVQRLERLENLAFGTIQEGNIITRFNKVENAILSRPQSQPNYNIKQSLMNGLNNYFNGMPTGFTPSYNSYGYNNMIEGNRGILNTPFTFYNNTNFLPNTSVRILD